MSEILFVIGAGLLLVGRIRLGQINAEGSRVRVAGMMLAMPLIIRLVLTFMLITIPGRTGESAGSMASLISFAELLAIITAATVTYLFLMRDGIGNIITIQRTQQPTAKTDTEKPASAPQKPVMPRPAPRQRANVPAVMTTAEAARYLNISEQALMDLINEGKISAARINYRYRISKSVLDDFIKQQRTGSATE